MLETLLDLLTFLGIILVGFLIWAALSPFEVMGWWAGWFGDTIYDGGVTPPQLAPRIGAEPACYLVFMSGIGKASGETHSYREQEFMRRLMAAMPGIVIVDDLFPYSVNNLPLTGQPFFARIWRWALQRKLHGPALAGYLINVRNIWQLLISADRRYGPLYNQALAEVVVHKLLRKDYDPAGRKPIFLLGYSGAAQLAVGPAGYVKEWLQAPVYIISLGGVFASDPSILAVDHIYHIHGKRDVVHRYGLLAPGRWSMVVSSDWNRALRQGRVTGIDMGPIGHTGRGGYLDHKSELADGTSYVDKTVQVVEDILIRHVHEHAKGGTALSSAAAPLPG